MNSIETYSVPKVAALEDESLPVIGVESDPLALETMRAMMSGMPGIVTPLPQTVTVVAKDDDQSKSSGLLQLLAAAASDESLPPALLPLVKSLSQSLAAGPIEADPEATAGLAALTSALAAGGNVPANGGTASAAAGTSVILSDESAALAQQLLLALNESDTPLRKPSQTVEQLRLELATALVPADESKVTSPAVEVEGTPSDASLGQSILQSLGAQSSASTAAVNSAPQMNQVPTVERVEQVSALMTEMADRVLVTDPIHGQLPEVRVKLADNIMPGTEVRVWRGDGGNLHVEFDTVSPYWARVLNEASPLLTQRLNERMTIPVPVEVVVQQQGGQPEDGRSRNRQNPWEVMAQNAEA